MQERVYIKVLIQIQSLELSIDLCELTLASFKLSVDLRKLVLGSLKLV